MTRQHRGNLICWLALVALGLLEFGMSFAPLPHGLRPLLLVPAIVMAVLVALAYMRLLSGPELGRGFAIAGLFWLAILLGLSIMDPLTRAVYAVPPMPPPASK